MAKLSEDTRQATAPVSGDSRVTARRVSFDYEEPVPVCWTPRQPELAAAANSVSLMMPYVEPYVVRSVRSVLDDLEPGLAAEARSFIGQELRHHAQHRRFNEHLRRQVPGLARIERWISSSYDHLSRRCSREFSLAFAAGSETVAFSLARWTERHSAQLFRDADPLVTTLFMWHLAEEVEHKSVAFDVYRCVDGSRLRYLWASAVSVALLTLFTILGSATMLHSQRRLFRPTTWWRLTVWSLSIAFEILPNLFVSSMRDHHPDDLADPIVLTTWLSQFDTETATMPHWWTSTRR